MFCVYKFLRLFIKILSLSIGIDNDKLIKFFMFICSGIVS